LPVAAFVCDKRAVILPFSGTSYSNTTLQLSTNHIGCN
jgi:hypothetical protein